MRSKLPCLATLFRRHRLLYIRTLKLKRAYELNLLDRFRDIDHDGRSKSAECQYWVVGLSLR